MTRIELTLSDLSEKVSKLEGRVRILEDKIPDNRAIEQLSQLSAAQQATSQRLLPKTFYGTDTIVIALDRQALDGSQPVPIKCSKYNYLTWSEMPTPEYIDSYYREVYYPTARKTWYTVEGDYNVSTWDGTVGAILDALKQYTVEKPLDQVKSIDIGCSFGGLVNALRLRGIQAYGVDLNPLPIAEGNDHGNSYISCELAKDFIQRTGVRPDLFLSMHTLEHFIDPFSFVSDLWCDFKDESIGYFVYPNGSHYTALTGNYNDYGWYAFPDHLHLFGPYSTFRLLRDRGFSILSFKTKRDRGIPYLTEGTKKSLSPLNPNSIISYDAYQDALEANYVASEVHVVFCKSDSSMARRNGAAIAETDRLFHLFEEKGL